MQFEFERLNSFNCPHCGSQVYFNVELPCFSAMCDRCNRAVPIPHSALRDGMWFKLLSESFVKTTK